MDVNIWVKRLVLCPLFLLLPVLASWFMSKHEKIQVFMIKKQSVVIKGTLKLENVLYFTWVKTPLRNYLTLENDWWFTAAAYQSSAETGRLPAAGNWEKKSRSHLQLWNSGIFKTLFRVSPLRRRRETSDQIETNWFPSRFFSEGGGLKVSRSS